MRLATLTLTGTAALLLTLRPVAGDAPATGALLAATRANDLTNVEALLLDGAAVGGADSTGTTPLMVAAAYGYTDLARLLLARGAEVETRGYIGNTALIYAVEEGNVQVAALLLASGADPTAVNDYGNSAASLAPALGRPLLAAMMQRAPETAATGLARLVARVAALLLAAGTILSVPVATVLLVASPTHPEGMALRR